MSTPHTDPFTLGLSIARNLVRAPAPGDAVRLVARLISDRYHRPVGGWLRLPGADGLTLVVAHGLRPGRRAEVRRRLRFLPAWSEAPDPAKQIARRQFSSLAEVERVRVIDAEQALLLVGDPSPELQQALPALGVLLKHVLLRLEDGRLPTDQEGQLELGLAWTAHELRSPLLLARMVLDRLSQGHDDAETMEKLLVQAREELDDLASLVDTLLPWAVGVGSFNRDAVDLRTTLEEAVHSCSVEAEKERVRIEAPEGVTLDANRDHLLSAVSNLVRNALAYSPEGTEILVEAQGRNGVVRISVRDEGPGVLPEEREAIFDPFTRGVAGRSRRGGGLGLFIARRAVEAHGGIIWVESGSGMVGTTFHLEIPRDSGRRHPSAS